MYKGSDPVEASAEQKGRCTNNLFKDNRLESATLGFRMSETRETQVIGNTFIDTEESTFEDSDGLLWMVRRKKKKELLVFAVVIALGEKRVVFESAS